MKVLGVVDWTDTDKRGSPIAGVYPLYEIAKNEWRSIDAVAEFPTKGLVFWPVAREAIKNALVFFRPEDNAEQKDEFRVADAQPAIEVMDLRAIGTDDDVRRAFANGLRTRFSTTRALIWCEPDLLLGPFKLSRSAAGTLSYEVSHRDRIPTFTRATLDLRTVRVGDTDRVLLATTATGAPSGYVDWDDDRVVIRRALATAVEHAKRGGNAPLTKKMIDEAADAMALGGTAADARLDAYRLHRARLLCADAAAISALASEISEVMLAHPSMTAAMDALRAKTRQDLTEALRSEIETTLAASRAELDGVRAEVAQAKAQHTAASEALVATERRKADARAAADALVANVEVEIASRLRPILSNPASVLAEVAVLKPFLSTDSGSSSPVLAVDVERLHWSGAGSTINDGAALRRCLAAAFKARGVRPTRAVYMHAAIVADLMPVLIGSGALAAVAAYADASCGGRACILSIGPGFAHPHDLAGSFDPNGRFRPSANGILAAAEAAAKIASPSLFVCEGLTRAPVESYLVPFLQMRASNMPLSVPGCGAFSIPAGLRLASTSIAGATSLPVSHDLWNHAVVFDTELDDRSAVVTSGTTEVALPSDLMEPGDIPEAVVDELVDATPWADEVRSCLERFGAALSRFESNDVALKSALVECVLVPVLATFGSDDERDEGLRSLQAHHKRSSEEPEFLPSLARRVRRRLG